MITEEQKWRNAVVADFKRQRDLIQALAVINLVTFITTMIVVFYLIWSR